MKKLNLEVLFKVQNGYSFIVPFWTKVFGILGKISIFYIVRKVVYPCSLLVDIWVTGNLLASILLSYITWKMQLKPVCFIVLVYSALRVFEVIVYQFNVLLFDSKRVKNYSIKSASRMVILLLHNYIEMVFWYSSMFVAMLVLLDIPIRHSWQYFVKSSFMCFAIFQDSFANYIALIKEQSLLSSLVFTEYLTGLIMTIISLARFIGLLPEVKSRDGH